MGTNRDYYRFPNFRSGHRDDGEKYGDAQAPPQTCLFCGTAVSDEVIEEADALCKQCDSPLARATRQQQQRSSRRSLRRIDQHIPVRVYVSSSEPQAIDGMMENLSLNGLRFNARHRFEPNQLIRIDSEPCQCLARITHSTESGDGAYSTGVEFVTIRFAGTDGASGGSKR